MRTPHNLKKETQMLFLYILFLVILFPCIIIFHAGCSFRNVISSPEFNGHSNCLWFEKLSLPTIEELWHQKWFDLLITFALECHSGWNFFFHKHKQAVKLLLEFIDEAPFKNSMVISTLYFQMKQTRHRTVCCPCTDWLPKWFLYTAITWKWT